MTDLQRFGERLAQLRREKAVRDQKDLERKDVAKAVRIDASNYSRYEAGLVKPRDDVLARIAAYFGVQRAWLLWGEGEQYADPATSIIKEVESERDVTAAHQPQATAKRAAGARGPRNR